MRCFECGCKVKAKAAMSTEQCPLHYWPKLEGKKRRLNVKK